MLIDGLRRKAEQGLAVLLITAAEGKVQLVAGLSRDLVERGLHAGNWLKQVAPIVGGGGGGRPDLAQAGGKNAGEDPRRPRASPQVDPGDSEVVTPGRSGHRSEARTSHATD